MKKNIYIIEENIKNIKNTLYINSKNILKISYFFFYLSIFYIDFILR